MDETEHASGDSEDLSLDEGDSGGAGSGLLIAAGVAIGLLIAFGIGPLLNALSGDDNSAADSASATDSAGAPPTVAVPATTETTTIDPEDNGDAVDLVVAYGRSRTDNHALNGQLLRPDQAPIPVRRAILDDRSIDETGATAAVTEAGETRQCELIDGQWLCAPPLPAVTAELDVQGFATLLLTEQPTYTVFDISPTPPEPLASIIELGEVTCWSMVSDGRVDRARFGAETTLCFHNDLGALIGRVTETSAGDDVFIADELRADVEIADVEPSR